MATYVPNADDLTQPTEDKELVTAAAEFRTLKAKVESNQTRIDTLEGSALQVVAGEYLATAPVDMAGFGISNLANATTGGQAVNLAQVAGLIGGASTGLTAILVDEQTATAGQTVFNLTVFQYLINSNNLAVYVNGIRQDNGTAYVETDIDTVTFLEPLVAGDFVQFYKNEATTSVADPVLRADLLTTGAGKGAEMVAFKQSGTGAVDRTASEKLREVLSAFDFMTDAQIADVQSGTLLVDVTAALQTFINACQNRRGYLPAGKYKITSALILDPQHSYIIEGDGWDPSANTGTAIWNYGTGNAIQIHGTGGYDQQIRLADMSIAGNASSQCGISVIKTLVFFENLWLTSHGFHGLRLEDAYGSAFKQCTVTQNFQHGVYVYRQGNALLFDHCVINGNSRTDGYSNCTLTGATGAENLGVTFTACDFTGAGYPEGVTTAFGLVVQHSRAVNLIGCYMEQNKLRNIYADTSVKGLTITGNYFQDGINEISDVDGLIYENNFHQQVYATTRADIASSTGARLPFRLHGNTYVGGASSNYTGGAKERAEIYSTAAPSSGTWQHGDIVWHSLPYSGGNLGWICTTSGTPGTWNSFGTISA